jgi:hypothetical protein
MKEPAAEYVLELPATAWAAGRRGVGAPKLRVPSGFAWLKHLDTEEQMDFFSSLLKVVVQAQRTGNWEPVSELVEEWQATASIYADSATMQALETARQERTQGEVVSLAALRRELGR